jgi:cytochrome oxidase assembly protein ShyY1
MRPRGWVIAVVSLLAAVVCVRLGIWQLSRWQQKRRVNATLQGALAAPPVTLGSLSEAEAGSVPRRVRAFGVYDTSWHLLVSDQWDGDSAGVELYTPLRLPDGGAVLVDRGWLPSPDGIEARPQDHDEPFAGAVPGLLEAPRAVQRPLAWQRLSGEAPVRWSARMLVLDSVRARLPYRLADRVLVALPARTAAALPRRRAPEPLDPGSNISYAVQWALFALAFLAGGTLVTLRELRRPPAA